MLQGVKLSQTQCPTTAEDREKIKVIPYASAIGSIMYAMLCTRPDVCLAISLAGRYQSNPGVDHWTAVNNILKYLKRTKDMFLVYGGDKELVVNGYVDASFDTNPDDSNTHGVLVLIMFCSSKRLSQRVCNIQMHMYFGNLYVSHLDLIPDGVEASLDVLGSLVKSGFLCQGNCTSIVTKDFHWTRCTRYDT